ncbi:MAG TPA: class II aldolase/adducin family protein, partial [Candidatus Limnocylindrales bacterium]
RIHRDPPASLAVLRVDPGGASARLFLATNAAFARPTIELNSHLAIHALRAGAADGGPGAIVHAHPLHLTYLSHLPGFAGSDEVSRRLRRWQAETVGFLPGGVGYVPFHPPGTTALREATLGALEGHRIALWAKHGVIACASGSVSLAVDYVDYLEAAARYEVLDLALGRPARGLGPAELAAIATVFGVTLDPPA